MDLQTLMATLLSDNNVNSVAGKAGVSNQEVASVMAAALPMLLNAANAQAGAKETSEGFYEAVQEHAKKDPEKVDINEGEKIVEHLLGDEEDTAAKAISKKTGLSKIQVLTILAALAPVIMNMLGKETSSSNSSANTASMLTSLLGGSSNSNATNALMTAALGAVLSGALNGNSSANNSTSILGSVLGSAMGANNNSNNNASAAMASALLGSVLNGAMSGNTNTSSNNTNSAASSLLGGLMGLLK